ncbi:cathepsin L1-like, partial [Tupaia chinensis]|uniref:cathepsin L1-like n=1 Tax=Tupaia chinensis TaxID=246437 RepID=UPI000FFBFAA5
MSPSLLLVILCLGVAAAAPTVPTGLDAQQQETANYKNLHDLVGNAEGSVSELSEEHKKMIMQRIQKYMEENGSNNVEMLSIIGSVSVAWNAGPWASCPHFFPQIISC